MLDGGVVVLDGSAGVKAQTVTVWRQAESYGGPRIANINKLDIPAVSVKKTLASIEKRLTVQPLWSLRLCWVGRVRASEACWTWSSCRHLSGGLKMETGGRVLP